MKAMIAMAESKDCDNWDECDDWNGWWLDKLEWHLEIWSLSVQPKNGMKKYERGAHAKLDFNKLMKKGWNLEGNWRSNPFV